MTSRSMVLGLLCAVLAAPNAPAERAPDPDELAGVLARCAAYFFNATNAKPIGEYEAYYSAGERAFNRAARMLDRATLDRLVGEAAIEMTAMTGGDWRNFARVEARYASSCGELVRPTVD